MTRCSDCAIPVLNLSGFRYFTDGTKTVLCRDCLREAMAIAEAHELNVRIHEAAHNWTGPGCPVCVRERERTAMWGDPR